MYAQFNYGRGVLQTDYSAFRRAFKSVITNAWHSGLGKVKIGLPYGIGCGLAGGDWEIVRMIIEEVAEEKNLDVYLYRLEGGK